MTQPNDNQPGPDGTAGNPNWNDVLDLIPEESRPAAMEKFRSWDTGVQERFTKLHSEFEPYKSVVGEYQPDDVGVALQIATALQSDPTGFVKQLVESYGIDLGQGQGNQQQNQQQQQQLDQNGEEDPYADRFSRVEQAIAAIANAVQEGQQQLSQREQDQLLDQTLASLKQQHGDFDEDYVLAKIANGNTAEQAIAAYKKLAGVTDRENANGQMPPILSSGGGLPSQQIDPRKLDTQGTEDLVAKLLAAANNQ